MVRFKTILNATSSRVVKPKTSNIYINPRKSAAKVKKSLSCIS